MKNDEFIRNKEYYKTSLAKILKFIIECDERLDTICCGYCLKCYSFDKIKIHKCKYIQSGAYFKLLIIVHSIKLYMKVILNK